MEIEFAYKYRDEVKMLFTEYTKMLVENDPKFQEYLDLQNYDDELDHLEAKYGLPDGRLYLLFCEGKAAGCIGLRKIDERSCEMKRLYVRPEFRGRGLGTVLVEKIIQDAKGIMQKASAIRKSFWIRFHFWRAPFGCIAASVFMK